MKTIRYETAGEMLTQGRSGSIQKQAIVGLVEKPYSEEAMREAEAEAMPGTIEIVDAQDPAAQDFDAVHERLDQLVLVDRASGKPYVVYVENGKLMMEEI